MIGAALAWTVAAQSPAATASQTTEVPRPVAKGLLPEAPSTNIVDQYDAAVDAFQAGQCDRAVELMAAVTASPDFGSLDGRYQSMAFAGLGLCAYDREDWKTAYDAFARASVYSDAPDMVFPFRFEAAATRGEHEDAVAALELAAAKRPASLGDVRPGRLFLFMRDLDKRRDTALRARFFAALDRADYHSSAPFDTASFLWVEYAGDLAVAGDTAAATRVLGRVDVPDALARALTDRRLIAVVDADPRRFDVRAVAERRLAQDRQRMADHPELLDGPNEVAMELRALGRPEEALALLDATLPRLKDKTAFHDFADKLPWFWDERSRTLRELGRVDEAIDALRTGAFAVDPETADVSLILNLEDFLVRTGKPQAALDEMKLSEKVDAQTSPYGRMVREQTRACAFALLGRREELKASLAYVAAHAADNWAAAADAPLCAGDSNMAAAAVIRALDDPNGRETVLIELSRFDPPAHQTALERQMDERRQEVASRPDVKAAIAKVGRTARFNIGSPES